MKNNSSTRREVLDGVGRLTTEVNGVHDDVDIVKERVSDLIEISMK